MLNIISNGSKWAGESPDSIEKLLEVLQNHPLDRRFEEFGGFIKEDRASAHVRYFGNFFNLSHVFQIDTDEPELIERLGAAIRANMERPDYLSQHRPCNAYAISGNTYPLRRELRRAGCIWNRDAGAYYVAKWKAGKAWEAGTALNIAEKNGLDVDEIAADPIDLEPATGDRLRAIRQDKQDRRAARLRERANKADARAEKHKAPVVKEGMTTPWGVAQHAAMLAEGIGEVSTASHGGIKLDRERLEGMPAYMRLESGWYEEDCEWSLVATIYPAAFTAPQHDGREGFVHARETLRNWYPHIYERYYGLDRPLTADESYVVREREKFLARGEPLPHHLKLPNWSHSSGGCKTELTECGEQHVIPGCERQTTDKNPQGSLW